MSGGWQAWRVLGIERTSDRGAIRRAYADRLRAMNPDADPDAYQDLRDARDAALAWAKQATEGEASPLDLPADAGPEPHAGEAAPGLPDWPITAPLIDRDVAAPLTAEPPSPPSPLRIAAGTQDGGGGEDIALPTTGSFATPVIDRSGETAPVTVLTNDTIVGAYDVYRDILLPGGEAGQYALTEQELAAALEAIDRFMLDPRLEQIEFRDHASTWVAAVAADAIPRSDPLLQRLADLLGWRALAGSLNEPPAIARVNERLDALDFVAAVSAPGHELNRAWRELTTPATEHSRRGFVRNAKVAALLAEVRQKHPEVEGWFDGYRVGLWENRVEGPGSPWWVVMLVIAAIQLVVQIQRANEIPLANGQSPIIAPYEQPLNDSIRDLDIALSQLGIPIRAAELRVKNDALYVDLIRIWMRLQGEAGTQAELNQAITDYFNVSRIARAKSVAPLELAVLLARNSLEQMEYIRRTYGEAGCASWVGVDPRLAPMAPDGMRQDRRKILLTVVVLVQPSDLPTKPRQTATIIGPTIQAMMDKLGWKRARLDKALDLSGPAADICQAGIALRQAALLRPEQNLELLRVL